MDKMVKLKDYCTITKGKIGIKKAIKGNYPLVTTADERLSHNEHHFDKPSVIIPTVSSTGHGHASLKRIHYQEGKFAIGSILCAVTPKDSNILNANFLYHYLDTFKEELLVSKMKGMANVTLPIKLIGEVEFPLLTLEEQFNWVQLFNKTVQNTDKLLHENITQKSLIKKLRQSILQDAISGKITEEWRKENPELISGKNSAVSTLKKIKTEKERLIKEKKLKNQKPLPPIKDDEIPFDLPEEWVWTRLGCIANLISGYGFESTDFTKNNGVKCIKITNAGVGKLTETDDTLPGKFVNRYSDYLVYTNDLVIALTRPYISDGLKICKCPQSYNNSLLNQRVAVIRNRNSADNDYIYLYMNSMYVLKKYKAKFQGVSQQPNLKNKDLIELEFPLPSLREQKIIVAKVETLFELCDQIEEQVNKSEEEAKLLMQSVLKEAFSGGK